MSSRSEAMERMVNALDEIALAVDEVAKKGAVRHLIGSTELLAQIALMELRAAECPPGFRLSFSTTARLLRSICEAENESRAAYYIDRLLHFLRDTRPQLEASIKEETKLENRRISD